MNPSAFLNEYRMCLLRKATAVSRSWYLHKTTWFKVSGTHLIWKLIFVLSSGAMNVFATAPAMPPDAEWMKMLDLCGTSLCNTAEIEERDWIIFGLRDAMMMRSLSGLRLNLSENMACVRCQSARQPTWWFLAAMWRWHCAADTRNITFAVNCCYIAWLHERLKVNFYVVVFPVREKSFANFDRTRRQLWGISLESTSPSLYRC